MNPQARKKGGFMAAIAKNPGFAKAGKGKKFGSGEMRAGVNNPKTRHGKMDMPNFKAPKFAMGGAVQRYDEGGLMPQGLLTPQDQIGGPVISQLAAQYRAALADRQMGGEEAPAPAAAPAAARPRPRPRPAAAPAAAPFPLWPPTS